MDNYNNHFSTNTIVILKRNREKKKEKMGCLCCELWNKNIWDMGRKRDNLVSCIPLQKKKTQSNKNNSIYF